MNWSRAKTIMIIFLLFTTVLLSSMLYTSSSKRNTISPETVANSIKILNSRGVKIDSSLFPNTLESAPIYTVDNAVSDYLYLAKSALGDDVQNSGNVYTSQKGTLVFSGDRFSITYTNGLDTDKSLKSPSEKARAYLMSLGLDLYDTDVKVKNDANGIFTVTFTSTLDKLPFFDRSISCTLKGEKLISVEGAWFDNAEFSPTQTNLDAVPSLLIKYSHENKNFTNIEITKIQLGYAINEDNIFHKQATVLPVYEVTTKDSRTFYIDARMR